VVEDQPSFAGNAEKKARAAHLAFGLPALGDDSGLEVDALGGAPGVYSARWAGAHDAAANNRKLLVELAGVADPRRTARFRCVLALVDGPGPPRFAEGACEGRILTAPRGTGGFGYDPLFFVSDLGRGMAELSGFGYDPLFFVSDLGRGMAELSLAEKNQISHRAKAFTALANALASRGAII
jgi:XTP/dITP diphosphohydrolase